MSKSIRRQVEPSSRVWSWPSPDSTRHAWRRRRADSSTMCSVERPHQQAEHLEDAPADRPAPRRSISGVSSARYSSSSLAVPHGFRRHATATRFIHRGGGVAIFVCVNAHRISLLPCRRRSPRASPQQVRQLPFQFAAATPIGLTISGVAQHVRRSRLETSEPPASSSGPVSSSSVFMLVQTIQRNGKTKISTPVSRTR